MACRWGRERDGPEINTATNPWQTPKCLRSFPTNSRSEIILWNADQSTPTDTPTRQICIWTPFEFTRRLHHIVSHVHHDFLSIHLEICWLWMNGGAWELVCGRWSWKSHLTVGSSSTGSRPNHLSWYLFTKTFPLNGPNVKRCRHEEAVLHDDEQLQLLLAIYFHSSPARKKFKQEQILPPPFLFFHSFWFGKYRTGNRKLDAKNDAQQVQIGKYLLKRSNRITLLIVFYLFIFVGLALFFSFSPFVYQSG